MSIDKRIDDLKEDYCDTEVDAAITKAVAIVREEKDKEIVELKRQNNAFREQYNTSGEIIIALRKEIATLKASQLEPLSKHILMKILCEYFFLSDASIMSDEIIAMVGTPKQVAPDRDALVRKLESVLNKNVDEFHSVDICKFIAKELADAIIGGEKL